MKSVKPSPMKAGFLAIRPPTLLVGAGPIILGGILGAAAVQEIGRTFSWFWFGLTLLTGLLLQAGANLVNDVKDAEKGVDQAELRLGPPRVTMLGWLQPQTVRRMYYAVFSLALLCAVLVSAHAGPGFLALGILCCVIAYGYTAGPKPLAYIGLGEVMAFLFFGPVAVLGTMAVQTQSIVWDALPLASCPGLIAAAVMAINNVRDMDSDRAAGKVTLPLLLGKQLGAYLPHALLGMAILIPALTWGVAHWGQSLLYLVMATLFVQAFVGRALRPALAHYNVALKRTAMLMILHVITISLLQQRLH